jgi:hypothetical protein
MLMNSIFITINGFNSYENSWFVIVNCFEKYNLITLFLFLYLKTLKVQKCASQNYY